LDKQGRFAWRNVKGSANTPWKPVLIESNTAGTYEIEDYTITLNYNNGKSAAYFFGVYPDNPDFFIIGGNHFIPVKD